MSVSLTGDESLWIVIRYLNSNSTYINIYALFVHKNYIITLKFHKWCIMDVIPTNSSKYNNKIGTESTLILYNIIK